MNLHVLMLVMWCTDRWKYGRAKDVGCGGTSGWVAVCWSSMRYFTGCNWLHGVGVWCWDDVGGVGQSCSIANGGSSSWLVYSWPWVAFYFGTGRWIRWWLGCVYAQVGGGWWCCEWWVVAACAGVIAWWCVSGGVWIQDGALQVGRFEWWLGGRCGVGEVVFVVHGGNTRVWVCWVVVVVFREGVQ